MKKEIIISEGNDLAVVFEDGRAVEFFLRHGDQLVGDIIWGQVEAVVPGIEAAFVNIGQEKNGFIHVADLPSAQTPRRQAAPKRPSIKVKERILVQIAKAPTGNKGARLTGRLTVPGRFLVLVPHDNRVSISRRITDTHERNRLRHLTLKLKDPGHGLIVRTEAIGRSEEDLRQDIDELIEIWADILHQVQIVSPPSLLHRDSDLIHRVLRDAMTSDVSRVVIDTPTGYLKAQEILKGWMPELAKNVVHHRGRESILDRYRIRKELEAAISPKVWLPSGGYLVIEHTEALTVIDVNSGRMTQSKSLADTVLKTNMEAAAEVARQLRLRDIGGIIVIDFISMDHAADRNKVLMAFHDALKTDKSRPQVTGFSEHGLIEVSRRRQGQNLLEQLTAACETCGGTGRIRTSELLPREAVSIEPPAAVAEVAAMVHEITDEPMATEIVMPEAAGFVVDTFGEEEEDEEGVVRAGEEGGEEGEGGRRRRRRRRGRGRGRAAGEEVPLGHMLTTTTPEGFSAEDEDVEGFLPPVMVPAEAPRRERHRRTEPAAAARMVEAVDAVLIEEASPFLEEVSLGDMFAAPAGGRERGGREDRGDRGGRGERGDRGERGGRGRERGGRDRDREPRGERPAYQAPVASAAPVARPAAQPAAFDVSAPGPRTRRVERRGEAPVAPAPAAVASAAPVVAPKPTPAPAVVAPVAKPVAPAAVAPKPTPAPVAPAAKKVEVKKPAPRTEPLPLPETLEQAAVPGLFVLKKKDKSAAKPAAAAIVETPVVAAPVVEEKKPAAKKAATPKKAPAKKVATEELTTVAPAPEAAPAEKPKATRTRKAATTTAKAEPVAEAAEKPAPKKRATTTKAKATKAKTEE